uniref:Uncharacterized protein n=1 Tax=Strongyloides stercoralis TaxID=6248 RepID=A0A913HV11_STRER
MPRNVTVSFNFESFDSAKVVANNAIQENDLPTSLKNQEIDQIYHFNNGKLEFFKRYKRQLRLSRGRQRLSRRSSQRRLSSSATRRVREREVQRRRRLISQRQEEIRRSQTTTTVKPATITETTKQNIDIEALLRDDAFIDRFMDRFHQRMRERPPPDLPPLERDARLYVSVSFQLKNFDSKKISFHNAIQENDLPASLKNQKVDEINYLNAGKLEHFIRYKRQSGLGRRRPQTQLSPAAARRARKRDTQRRRRLIAQRKEEIRRLQTTTTAKPATMSETTKQSIDIESLLKDDAVIDKIMDKLRQRAERKRPPPRRLDSRENIRE